MRILKYDIEKVTGIPWKKKKSYRYLYRLACREDVIKKAFKSGIYYCFISSDCFKVGTYYYNEYKFYNY